MAILNKRISSATLPQLQKDARLGSIIRDVDSAPAVTNDMYRSINPSMSVSNAASPAYVSQLTSALRELQNSPQGMTSRIAAPTRSNNVSLMSSQMPEMSGVPNISKGPITSITSPGDSVRQKIGSTTTTSGGVPSAVINALAGAVMGLGAQKILTGGNKTTTTPNQPAKQNPPVTSTVGKLPTWAKGNPTIKDNGNGTYTQTNDDGSTSTMDKDGNIIGTTDSDGNIVDKNGNTVHDNGDGTHTITARDGTVTIRNDDGTDVTGHQAGPEVVTDPVDGDTEYTPQIEYGDELKRGGLAVMMKDGGVAHFKEGGVTQDNGNGTSTTTYPDKTTITKDDKGNIISRTDASGNILSGSDPMQDLLDLLGTSGGAAGAGGLLAALLSSTGGNETTQNTGLDMSTYGLLKPRTTNFGMGPTRYVPFKDYSQRGNYTPNAELLSNLNAPASNPVNEGDYQSPYITNRPGTDNNMAGGMDINALIAQIVNALQNKKLAQNVQQASTGNVTAGPVVGPTGGSSTGTSVAGVSTGPGAAPVQAAPATPAQKLAYKQWMLAQPNPAGPGTLADLYKAQGVDPMTDPRVDAQAQSEVERANRRIALTGNTDVAPWDDKDWQKYQGTNKEAYTLATQAKNDPAAYAKLKRDNGWDDTTAQSWIVRSTEPEKWNAQAAAASAAAGLVAGPGGAPKASTTVDPNKPWETASSDANIKAIQDQLAALNATTGTQAQRQAALDKFLATTTASPTDLATATNGVWGANDILNLMIQNGNPIGQQTEIARPTTPSRSRALGAGTQTDSAPSFEPAKVIEPTDYSGLTSSLSGVTKASSPLGQTNGIPLQEVDPYLPQDPYAPKQPISYGGDGGLYGPGGMFPSQELDPYIPPSGISPYEGEPIERVNPPIEPTFNEPRPVPIGSDESYNYATPAKMQTLEDYYSPWDYSGAKKGGVIHKATGGLTHYTYGKPADVMENLGLREQQMAQGGLPHVSNVPIVQGRMDFRQGSAVHGEGDGQSDDIPAMLADGEYVIDAETVAQIGNGSTKAGAQALDKFRESIRAHKRSAPINKIPPKTKALTSYLKVK